MEYDWERMLLYLVVVIVIAGVVCGLSYALCFTSESMGLNSALSGCINCEYNASNGNYYLFTCDNDSYKITEQQYLNLKFNSNISECYQ